MSLEIVFDPDISAPSGSRLVLNVGEASIRSYPMSAEDHYRNLAAFRYFLANRTLSNILLGDEPVAGVRFLSDGDLVALRPYRKPGEKMVSGEFILSQGLSQISSILDKLTEVMTLDKSFLEKQVADDINAGVYDNCLIGPNSID